MKKVSVYEIFKGNARKLSRFACPNKCTHTKNITLGWNISLSETVSVSSEEKRVCSPHNGFLNKKMF